MGKKRSRSRSKKKSRSRSKKKSRSKSTSSRERRKKRKKSASSASSTPPRKKKLARGGFDSQRPDAKAADSVGLVNAQLRAEKQLQAAFAGVYDSRDPATVAQNTVIGAVPENAMVPSSGVPFKSGDWLCPTCSAHNYRDKGRCFRCGTCQPERRALEHLAVLAAAGVDVKVGTTNASAGPKLGAVEAKDRSQAAARSDQLRQTLEANLNALQTNVGTQLGARLKSSWHA